MISSWFEPFNDDVYRDWHGNPHWLSTTGWFPGDGALFPTDNGSMEKRFIPFVVEQVDRYVRKIIGTGTKFVLSLDVHSSRNGYDWPENCVAKGIEVVQSPPNTSHFLQPCDAYINKSFQFTIRTLRDELCSIEVQDTKSMGFKLKLGVAGYRALSEGTIQASFTILGLWPMDYRFLDKFKTEESMHREKVRTMKARLDQRKGRSGGFTVLNRHTDASMFQEITNVMGQRLGLSTTISRLSKILSERRTVQEIVCPL